MEIKVKEIEWDKVREGSYRAKTALGLVRIVEDCGLWDVVFPNLRAVICSTFEDAKKPNS